VVYSCMALYSVNGWIEPHLSTAFEDVGLDVPTGLEDLVAASPALL